MEGIKSLNINEQLDLIDALSRSIKARVDQKRIKKHSIMELEGLGAEIWKGIDAREYISKERESWD
ncbi:MAG: hypothetical protein JRG68_04360 [Deltaproteobacteria bacterium]|nr:hypothetical protein [Deltaproteobacteria bacterium]MBW2011403.1 hypothetical protein [Deltaproteobacteria bacterium]MBW2099987.1 hypothetical protein [Deltaproteobacteria bacterium]